jgi:hypothetical protein
MQQGADPGEHTGKCGIIIPGKEKVKAGCKEP